MTDAALRPGGLLPKIEAIRANWGWFVALGIAMLVLGVIALGNLVVATVASVWFYGILLIIGGVAEIIHAFRVQTWGKMILELLAGLLYAVAGVICIMNPILASAVLTLMIGVAFIVTGIFRILAGFDLRPATGWGWVVAGGVMTVLLGILIIISWPGAALWVLGMFLGIDFVMQGVAWIALGLACKSGKAAAGA
jgi:uncharacterized membrane protein HdeD (DUF308 family)